MAKSRIYSINRQHRALGRLWNYVCVDKDTQKRFIFEDIQIVPLPEILKPESLEQELKYYSASDPPEHRNIRFMVYRGREEARSTVLYVHDGDAVIFKCLRKDAIRVQKITVEGQGTKSASAVMAAMKDVDLWKLNGVDRKRINSLWVPSIPLALDPLHSCLFLTSILDLI